VFSRDKPDGNKLELTSLRQKNVHRSAHRASAPLDNIGPGSESHGHLSVKANAMLAVFGSRIFRPIHEQISVTKPNAGGGNFPRLKFLFRFTRDPNVMVARINPHFASSQVV